MGSFSISGRRGIALSLRRQVPALTLAAALATVLLVASPCCALTKLGDVNGDGKVDLSDAVLAAKMAVGLLKPDADQLRAADVAPVPGEKRAVGDGAITVSDATRILRYVVGLIPEAEFAPAGESGQVTLRVDDDQLKAAAKGREIAVPVLADGVKDAMACSVTLSIVPLGSAGSGPQPRIVGVDPGEALPENTQVETSPEEIPAEGVSRATAGFFLASGKSVTSGGVLFYFRVLVPKDVAIGSRFALRLSNGDVSDSSSEQMLVVLGEGVLEVTDARP